MLVSSRPDSNTEHRWFGLILLPFVSFSADGAVVIWKFLMDVRKSLAANTTSNSPESGNNNDSDNAPERIWKMWKNSLEVSEFAHGHPIDLCVQFTLWWTPMLVLLGWWTGKPMLLLFGTLLDKHLCTASQLMHNYLDYFEVAMILGACFLVNYVTVDSKTNMSEGLTMICFYVMIVRTAVPDPNVFIADRILYTGNSSVVVSGATPSCGHAGLSVYCGHCGGEWC